MSPVEEIEREWRFFIVDGKVVARSQYKRYDVLVMREPFSEYVWGCAEGMEAGLAAGAEHRDGHLPYPLPRTASTRWSRSGAAPNDFCFLQYEKPLHV
jgi:hypothetical protein